MSACHLLTGRQLGFEATCATYGAETSVTISFDLYVEGSRASTSERWAVTANVPVGSSNFPTAMKLLPRASHLEYKHMLLGLATRQIYLHCKVGCTCGGVEGLDLRALGCHGKTPCGIVKPPHSHEAAA